MTRVLQADGWLHWLDRLTTDEMIRNAANQPVMLPIEGLQLMSHEQACKALDEAWSETFVLGPQHIEFLRLLLDEARSHSRRVYPTLRDYNRQRGGEIHLPSTAYPIRCLTGLAGVSKSSLMRTLVRISEVNPSSEFVADGQRLILYPIRRISIRAHLSVNAVLRSLANPVAVAGP